MRRKVLVVANWKMNKTTQEAILFLMLLLENCPFLRKKNKESSIKVILCPPFLYIYPLYNLLPKEILSISIGGQDASIEQWGAYTGEISPLQLKYAGAEFTIIGHSERRIYFKEDDKLINKKIRCCIDADIGVIFCVGEDLKSREANLAEEVVSRQLEGGLKYIDRDSIKKNVVIAYEPVWAIGTGKNATPSEVESMHKTIRNIVCNIYDKEIGDNISILYGGSVTTSNIKELILPEDVDGVLVGGASLDVEDFSEIVKIVFNNKGG